MSKERIVMVKEIVENDAICVYNEHTMFVHKNRITFPDIHQLEKDVKRLRKTLKDSGVSLGRTGTLKMLKEQKQQYIDMVNEYNSKFDQLVESWKKKVADGMYVGYRDDAVYFEELKPLEWSIEKMLYRNTLLSQVLDVNRKVKEIENDLKYGTNYIKVYI